MNKKIGTIVIAIIVILLGATYFIKNKTSNENTTSKESTINITHRYGETTVPKNPKRVVVLDYGSVDILDNMGIDIVGLPKSSIPNYLEKFKDDKYTDLGALLEFSLEKINELKPDLIIIEGRQEKYYDELSKIAPTIGLGTEKNDHFGSLKKNVNILGSIFEKEDFAKNQLENIDKEVKELNEQIKRENKNALVAMVNEGTISVFGQGSRFTTIYDEFGFNLADDKISDAKHGQNITYEYLLDKNPGYLFVIDKGVIVGNNQESAKDVIEKDIVKGTNAYTNNKIIYLTPETWYLGGSGITATNNMIKEISNAIK
ncbi:siderophore ABC transporter substrate-binding protein [Clostridium frigidicarnis]|uniref:Iron complex transport system substrate-binding protein n=1 Tax=Clostridium frigidicarnis TaxID=84698 RepID=A0A1I0XH33_9CLOT|nr:siderophore ABC transporter substrate-binding protein [Clostridium frigidicarnis]SFB00409.1 iron complex transport system substrate-binding protein [Clostridium frigidicarnis]